MTKLNDNQVLKKCMEIAESNGWIKPEVCPLDDATYEYPGTTVWVDMHYIPGQIVNRDNIILSHEFAKALFGEDMLCLVCYHGVYVGWEDGFDGECNNCGFSYRQADDHEVQFAFEYHLQQLVIAPDRIGYLRNWLDNQQQ